MSDINILKSFSVTLEAFENFQASSMQNPMELNTHVVPIASSSCENNEEITFTIDEVGGVNSTTMSLDTKPLRQSLRTLSKHKTSNIPNNTEKNEEMKTMSENIAVDSTIKDQQISTTQDSSESVNEEDGSTIMDEDKKNRRILKTNVKRSRGRPRKNNVTTKVCLESVTKRKVGRPKKQILLVEKNDNKTLQSDCGNIRTSEKIPTTEHHSMLSGSKAADSTSSNSIVMSSEITTEKSFYSENCRQQVLNENDKNEAMEQTPRDPKCVISPNSEEVKVPNTEDNLNESFNKDCVDAKGSHENVDADEIFLSKLKITLSTNDNDGSHIISEDKEINVQKINTEEDKETSRYPKKRPTKIPVMSDFVYNIGGIDRETSDNIHKDEHVMIDNSTTVENVSGRPQRNRGKVNLHYDEGSDEDPFANIELSDDEPRRFKKGKRYFSDDEYVPDNKRGKNNSPNTSDTDIDKEKELEKPRKKLFSKSLKKKENKSDFDELKGDTSQSIDITLTPDGASDQNKDSVRLSSGSGSNNNIAHSWGNSNEIENFLAKKIQGTNLKIKRVSNKQNSAITHLDIPVLDSYTASKTVDKYSQTNTAKFTTTAVQTTTPLEIQMEKNVPLTAIQAEKACEFLTEMVRTTSKIGVLMSQKSEDFIERKINTKNLTGTMKLDHYVKKSFLLFKLAKDSIMDVEANLSNKYEDFVKKHKLSRYTEVPKIMSPTVTLEDDDSDCEIIEETSDTQNVKGKLQPKSSLKRVFLNKELSIKIAKKPNTEKKIKDNIDIKGKNSMWISDSVVVKKIKPTQSFLAQDSRNKKPPDMCVTNEMVSDFFKKYYAVSTCARFITTEWQNWSKIHIWQNRVWCYYFNVEPTNANNNLRFFQHTESINAINDISTNGNSNTDMNSKYKYPKSLFTLSIQVLHKKMIQIKNNEMSKKKTNCKSDGITNKPEKLSILCLHTIKSICQKKHLNFKSNGIIDNKPEKLSKLCLCKIKSICQQSHLKFTSDGITDNEPEKLSELCLHKINSSCQKRHVNFKSDSITDNKPEKLSKLCLHKIKSVCQQSHLKFTSDGITDNEPEKLSELCLHKINSSCQKRHVDFKSDSITDNKPEKLSKFYLHKIKSVCQQSHLNFKSDGITDNEPENLSELCLHKINSFCQKRHVNFKSDSITDNKPEKLSKLCLYKIISICQQSHLNFKSDGIIDNEPEKLSKLCLYKIKLVCQQSHLNFKSDGITDNEPEKLSELCLHKINSSCQKRHVNFKSDDITDNKPEKLGKLCLHKIKSICKKSHLNYKSDGITDNKPEKLKVLCLHKINSFCQKSHLTPITVIKCKNILSDDKVASLKKLCYCKIVKHYLICKNLKQTDTCLKQKSYDNSAGSESTPLIVTCDSNIQCDKKTNKTDSSCDLILKSSKTLALKTVVSLHTLCYNTLIPNMFTIGTPRKSNTLTRHEDKIENVTYYNVKTLLFLSLNVILTNQKINQSYKRHSNELSRHANIVEHIEGNKVNSLSLVCSSVIQRKQCAVNRKDNTMSVQQVKNIRKLENCRSMDVKQDHKIINKCKNNIDDDIKMRNTLHTSTNKTKLVENFENRHGIQNDPLDMIQCGHKLKVAKTLFELCFDKVQLISNNDNISFKNTECNSIQINSVNTVPEELFFSFQEISSNDQECIMNSDDEARTYDEDLSDNYNEDETLQEECNFESKQPIEEISMLTKSNNCTSLDDGKDSTDISNASSIAQIKTEPIDNNHTEIKTELDLEANFIPQIDCIESTKLENEFEANEMTPEGLSCFGNNSNFKELETLLNRKVMKEIHVAKNNHEQKVFSQSSLRIRKQFEPDSDGENENNMSLLVPNTYEPLNNEIVKNTLNANTDTHKDRKVEKKKKKNEKRIEKKKIKQKTSISKDADNVEQTIDNENDLSAQKLGNKVIEEKNSNSSDSEPLNVILNSRKNNKWEGGGKELRTYNKKSPSIEVQCNDVDSTQDMSGNIEHTIEQNNTDSDCNKKNGVTEYNKYINSLYSEMKNNVTDVLSKKQLNKEIEEVNGALSPTFNTDEAVELIQCEPSLTFLDNMDEDEGSYSTIENTDSIECNVDENNTDWKLYQRAIVVLEKLPKKVLDAFLKSQGVFGKNKIENKRFQIIPNLDQNTKRLIRQDRESSYNYKGLLPDPTTSKSAKKSNLLEDCDKTKPELSIKDENGSEDTSDAESEYSKDLLSRRLKNKQKKVAERKEVKIENDSKNADSDTLLTADKVMKKDLILLNTPAVVDNVAANNPTTYSTRAKRKSETPGDKDDIKTVEYSSSEEEKQWVTTKEKLLKRLLKKQGDTRMDAAKRAKIVNEFIEKCEATESRKRYPRTRRSKRNLLERQKQLEVLSKELFGETSNESHQAGKKSSQTFGKGRRNIRRVIDKKSLARSTLTANIQEIERKRRLIFRQTKLREMLGCEEDVNVVVINDEVCLEYDFEENRPVVTVHPFFTQVMKAHQYEGVKFMWDACFESVELVGAGHEGGGCILAHCMGLGKTLQVLALLHTVLTHPRVGIRRVLVVCPLSTVLNWVDEIHKWMGPVTDNVKVFELSKLKKTYERAYQLEDWYTGGGIFIMGYEMFRNLSTLDPILDELRPTIVNKIRTALLDPGPDIIICDEGHLLKNDSSVLAVAISRIATKRRIILTGTPMQNNLREYYCMVNFVKPNLLGLYSEYANRFENPIMNGQHRDSREEDIKLMKARTHILHKVLEGCLQRQEVSVLYPYLPKKHEYTVFVPLTKCQTELYKHYLAHYAKQSKHNILKDYHSLQKIWTHPQVLHNFQLKNRDENTTKVKVEKFEDDLACEDLTASEDVKPSPTEVWWLEYLEGGNMLESLESSNKFFAIFRILDECIALGDKVLIFSTSLFTLDALEYFLKKINKWNLGREYYRLDGSVPSEVRQKWCRDFNAPTNQTTNVFLISTRAGCLGLNMTAANRVIILDTSWNPAHDIQSIFRVYRFGQKKDCYIYRLVAMGTMEQKIYERSVTKQAVACRVVDSQQIDRHYNMEELTELYKFDETGSSVESGVAAGVTDVALLRVARDAPLHAVYEHDSLLRDSHDQQLPEHERAAAWKQFEIEQGHSQIEVLEKKTPTKRIQGHDNAKPPSSLRDNDDAANGKKTSNTKGRNKQRTYPKKQPKKQISVEDNVIKKEEDIVINKEDNIINKEEDIIIKEETAPNEEDSTTAKVQQIKNILLQQNVRKQYSDANDITKLVTRVREVVEASLKGETARANDALVESLARVFLEKEIQDVPATESSTSTTIPKELDEQIPSNSKSMEAIVKFEIEDLCDSESTASEENNKTTKNKRKRKRSDYEKNNSLSHQTDDSDNIIKNKKRRAAVKAKEYINSLDLENCKDSKDDENWLIDDDSSDIDLDKDESDEEIVTTTVNSRTCDTVSVDKVKKAKKAETSKTITVEIPDDDDSADINIVADNSIVLSDDDAVVIEKSEPKKETKENNKFTNNEKIPLHASLLKNQYFINMVAYKYLEGNTALDKDAALHAAQYSTQKALREIEETGKDLYSGPLYDIAINSIGIDTLKRLQDISVKCHSTTDQPKENKDASKKDKTTESVLNQSEKKGDRRKSKKDEKNKSKQKEPSKKNVSAKRRQKRSSSTDSDDLVLISEDVTREETKNKSINQKPQEETERKSLKCANQSQDTRSTLSAAAENVGTKRPEEYIHHESDPVVPIKLIRRSSNVTITMTRPTPVTEECILPDDDDDLCFINHTPPVISRDAINNRRPLILTSVQAGSTNVHNKLTVVAATKSINVNPTSIIPDNVITFPVEAPTVPIDLDNENHDEQEKSIHKEVDPNTICLDSDEEDANVVPKPTILSTPKSSHSPSQFDSVSKSTTQQTNTIVSNETITSTGQSSNDNLSDGLNSKTKKNPKPGDVININNIGEVLVVDPTQYPTTVASKNPTAKPNSSATNIKNSKVGKVAIKAVKAQAKSNPTNPHPLNEDIQPEQNGIILKKVFYKSIASLPTKIQATKKTTPSGVTEKKTIEIYYPNKKNNSAIVKQTKLNISECVDLTDIQKAATNTLANTNIISVDLQSKYTNIMPHKSNIKSGVAVVGSPKDFLIVRTGDKTKLLTANLDYSTISRKRKEPTTQFGQSNDAKKMLVTSEDPGTSKAKIKAFDKFALDEFNIDKMDDDIIELD